MPRRSRPEGRLELGPVQSHRRDPMASPVRHSECSRTGTFSSPVIRRARTPRAPLPSLLFQNATTWYVPKRVGSSAMETIFTQTWFPAEPSALVVPVFVEDFLDLQVCQRHGGAPF